MDMLFSELRKFSRKNQLSNEQWIKGGNCKKCRRKEHCTKHCKEHKTKRIEMHQIGKKSLVERAIRVVGGNK